MWNTNFDEDLELPAVILIRREHDLNDACQLNRRMQHLFDKLHFDCSSASVYHSSFEHIGKCHFYIDSIPNLLVLVPGQQLSPVQLFLVGWAAANLYASSGAQCLQLSDIYLYAITNYFLVLRGTTPYLHTSSSPEHIERNNLHFDAIADFFLFIRGTSSYLHTSTGSQYFEFEAPPPIYTPPPVLSTSSDVTFTSTPSPIPSSSSSEEAPPIYTPPLVLSTSSSITFTSTPSPSSSSLSSSSSSSVGVPPIYTPPTVISISSTSTATPAPSCTNGIETDADGVQYEVQCGSDTTGGSQGTPHGTSSRTTSYRDCFAICNDTPNCQGFVWVGAQGSYGNGPGNCYFKGTGEPGQEIAFVPGTDSSHVACIIANPAPPATTTSSSTATFSSTSVGEPPIYTPPAEITTTTTTTTSTSPSSSAESPPIYSPPVQPTTTTTTTTTSTSSSSEVPPVYTPPPQPTTTTTTTTTTSSSSEVPPIYTPPPQPTTTTTTTTTTSSSTSSSAPAGPSCPYAPDTIITDDNGIDYTVRCNADTTGGGVGNGYATTNSANSFDECFTICDGYPTCQGFVWLGAANSYGSGAGNCYFKGADPGQTIAFTNSDSAHFAAIKVNQNGPAVYPVTTTTTTTTTSSSSSVDIFVPTTTTTTTTSTSSSSTITSRVIYTPPPPSQISTSVSSTTSITFTSQPARLSCARQGYLVQNFNWFVVEIATGNIVQNGSIQGSIPMQAMGYNRCDGLIYATDQEAHLVRFGLDLNPQRLYDQTFFRYQTGEVDNDCQYWAIRTADNDVARWIHVDVNQASPVYGSIVGQGELAVPQYFYADWAYVPGAGSYLWSVGIDQPTANAYLYRFDQATLTSIIVASFGDIGLAPFIPDPASGYRLNFGAVYASADGYLYGSENISGNVYRFTVTEPYNWQFLVRGPGTVQNDGARCIDNTEAIGTY
ncbi:hypothetical protein KC351_g17508 [Hortaea werneckii]|nr:hypothetical protein KC351_g17508 [Hortaea werneckii]